MLEKIKSLGSEKVAGFRRAVTLVVGLGMFMTAVAANAVGSDGATAVDGEFTNLKNDILTVYVPAFLALIVLGVGIRMGVKWLRAAANKA